MGVAPAEGADRRSAFLRQNDLVQVQWVCISACFAGTPSVGSTIATLSAGLKQGGENKVLHLQFISTSWIVKLSHNVYYDISNLRFESRYSDFLIVYK